MVEFDLDKVIHQAELALVAANRKEHQPLRVQVKSKTLKTLAVYLHEYLSNERQKYWSGESQDDSVVRQEDLGFVLLSKFTKAIKPKTKVELEISLKETGYLIGKIGVDNTFRVEAVRNAFADLQHAVIYDAVESVG